jgi:hypothetical protein
MGSLRNVVIAQLFDAVNRPEESKSRSFLRFGTPAARFDADSTWFERAGASTPCGDVRN